MTVSWGTSAVLHVTSLLSQRARTRTAAGWLPGIQTQKPQAAQRGVCHIHDGSVTVPEPARVQGEGVRLTRSGEATLQRPRGAEGIARVVFGGNLTQTRGLSNFLKVIQQIGWEWSAGYRWDMQKCGEASSTMEPGDMDTVAGTRRLLSPHGQE